ncbi:flagellar biosynthesis regulator FlaF [Pelagibacterium halotolerans]|uniref:flagellar biosynthesis regulator FlaF n=1 Tax=Pelagibacterium halotolerans TaxID=531813 RepID=UPI00384B9E6A
MYQHGALAYQQTARQTANPRDLEANLLAKLAGRLQQIRDNWPVSPSELDEALTRNRKVWSIFIAAVTDDASPLPAPIRENIANLGIFVMGQTMEIMGAPTPEKLDALININRQIAAGLRSKPDTAA